MKPKLLVLQGERNFKIPTYVESNSVREYFDVVKSSKYGGDPDLVYCQAYGGLHKELMKCRAPLVLHTGGSPWLELTGERLAQVTEVARKAARVVCNSRFLEGVFRENLGTDNITRLPDGLWGLDHTPIGPMPHRFKPKEDYSTQNGEFVCVMSIILKDNQVKRNKWQGVPLFLEAVEKVARRNHVRFICAGRGSQKFPHLTEWRTRHNFHFVPSHHLDDGEDYWPELLRRADLFVHPSMFDCWPRVVADAALIGLPGIVLDATGNAEISGVYPAIEPHDFVTMSAEFERLVASKIHREVEGVGALHEALDRTDQHRGDYARILLEVLK